MTTDVEPKQSLLFALEETPEGFGKLSLQEQKFLLSYVSHGNAAGAAREAGYSTKAAKQVGSQLLTRADFQMVLHQMSHQLGCSLENKIVRQEQLAAAMAGIALDEKRKTGDRISAAKTAVQCDALLAGLKGQLKVRAHVTQELNGTVNHTAAFQITPEANDRVAGMMQMIFARESDLTGARN